MLQPAASVRFWNLLSPRVPPTACSVGGYKLKVQGVTTKFSKGAQLGVVSARSQIHQPIVIRYCMKSIRKCRERGTKNLGFDWSAKEIKKKPKSELREVPPRILQTTVHYCRARSPVRARMDHSKEILEQSHFQNRRSKESGTRTRTREIMDTAQTHAMPPLPRQHPCDQTQHQPIRNHHQAPRHQRDWITRREE
uniref:Uncharacterized protein n=1 Tax=Xenopus tropicalis TaxID=8364 RepID=A0A1B8Y2V0_XENTR